MGRFLAALFLILLLVAGVGFYRGWFSVSEPVRNGNNKIDVNLQVDVDKVKEDANKAKRRTNEVIDKAADDVDHLINKAHEEK